MKKAITFSIITVLLLPACGPQPGVEAQPEHVVSTVSAEDCFLCGNGAEPPVFWGRNNVGLISLNTFEVMTIVINRYDMDGELIEKNLGCTCSHGPDCDSAEFSAHVFEEPDRGHAMGELSFQEDEVLDAEKTAQFLCQDCLDDVLSQIQEKAFGVGVVNFATREIQPLETCSVGVSLGDYYMDLDWKEPKKKGEPWALDFQVFYCPLRYDEFE